MRSRREELGLTVREVALRVGLRESSGSYVSQLESGSKAPNADLAQRLAEALNDDARIYLAWASTARRSDPVETARAVRLLGELLHHPRYELTSGISSAAPERADAPEPSPQQTAGADPPAGEPIQGLRGHAAAGPPALPLVRPVTAPASGPAASAGLLVPEFEEGTDPGDEGRAAPRAIATHAVDPDGVSPSEPLIGPFALRLSESGVRRVRQILAPGEIALLTRRTWPLDGAAPYAVRLSGHVLLARVLWNGRQLLLLPGPGDSDFLVLEAQGRTALERLLAGRVVGRLGAEP